MFLALKTNIHCWDQVRNLSSHASESAACVHIWAVLIMGFWFFMQCWPPPARVLRAPVKRLQGSRYRYSGLISGRQKSFHCLRAFHFPLGFPGYTQYFGLMDEKAWDSCNMLTFSINTFSSRHSCSQFSMPTFLYPFYKMPGCIRLEPSFLHQYINLAVQPARHGYMNNYFNLGGLKFHQ